MATTTIIQAGTYTIGGTTYTVTTAAIGGNACQIYTGGATGLTGNTVWVGSAGVDQTCTFTFSPPIPYTNLGFGISALGSSTEEYVAVSLNGIKYNFIQSNITSGTIALTSSGQNISANVSNGYGITTFLNSNAPSTVSTFAINTVPILGANGALYQIFVTAPDYLIGLTKSVDKNYATLNDNLTYSIKISNTGIVTATSITFSDTLPTGTTFTPGTMFFNGAPIAGTPSSVNLGNIGPNSVNTLTFTVSVNSATPQGKINSAKTVDSTALQTISNSVVTTVNYAKLSSSKATNKIYANIGDILTYTIPITNSGNVTANSVIFLDTLPSGTTLVANSFNQDGIAISGSPSFVGVTLPNNIAAFRTSTISFKVLVTTIPTPNPITNSATETATFIINPTTTPNITGKTSANTNTVSTQVNHGAISSSKSSDTSFADCGDIITYTIVLSNTGNVSVQNIVFKDTIPNGTILVPNSFAINGVIQTGLNPSIGVTIPNINPGLVSTLNYQVKIVC